MKICLHFAIILKKERQAIFLRFNHLIDMDDYSVAQWNEIVALAEKIKANPEEYSEKCKGKIMATLFYER